MTKSDHTMHENLKRLRAERKMNQVELARVTGLSQGCISQLENGERLPSPETMTLIAKALRVSEEELMGNTDDLERMRLVRGYQALPRPDKRLILQIIDRLNK
jgi:transcriptional regulator with XRE-family HTH domain